MKNFPTVISFYTKDTLYEKEIQPLKDSCKKFDLDFEIEGVSSLGTWEKNCCFKPTFILEKLKSLKKPLLWVDADALFVQPPKDFHLQCDFSTRRNEEYEDTNSSKVISNTVYVNYTQTTIELLQEWEKECFFQISKKNRLSEVWDQVCLRDVLSKNKKIHFQPMPLKYCRIIDDKQDQLTETLLPLKDMILIHFQASRILKKIINEELIQLPFLDLLSPLDLKLIRCTEEIQKELSAIKDFSHAKKS